MYKKGRVNSNSRIISTDEDPSLRIESSAIINLRGVSTKLNKYMISVIFRARLCLAFFAHIACDFENWAIFFNFLSRTILQ